MFSGSCRFRSGITASRPSSVQALSMMEHPILAAAVLDFLAGDCDYIRGCAYTRRPLWQLVRQIYQLAALSRVWASVTKERREMLWYELVYSSSEEESSER